jgi:hypothetical protein
MKSRITIEIDHDNQPIIKINYEPSGDVRDALVKRFMESFGGASCWATFLFDNAGYEANNRVATIRPIHPTELPEKVGSIVDEAKRQASAQSVLEGQFPGVMQ